MGHLSRGERVELWSRYRAGEPIWKIALALSRSKSTVSFVLDGMGGISPPPRTRAPRSLSLAEREEISRGMATGQSLRSIARALGRAPRA